MNRKRLLLFVLITLTLGLLVILLNPDYRATARGLLSGSPKSTPIWQSNSLFYESIE